MLFRSIGKTVILPLAGRELPIIADEHVDPAFGTGALKVTPAHDPNDFEIARRHGLPEVSVIGEDGKMTALAGDSYAGLPPMVCRKRVLDDLHEQGAIRAEEPYTHNVPFSHRSGLRIEPLLSLQWFCDMTALAEPAIAAVKDGRVRFTPERFGRVYLDWMENIRPWCVSRQLWWGHQIPVWYRGDEIHVGADAPEGDGWERDPDVLDTWFSSALWPFATQGWPEATPELAAFYPGDVLVTGRDIIFLWVARMVMMGLEFMDDIPFDNVVINPIIQAPDGRRMSKSLGTGIDPLDLIDGHGADAVRFGLLLMASTQDVRFNEQRILQGRQLATKLWNATRLVIERGGRAGFADPPQPVAFGDRWICSYLRDTVGKAKHLVDDYDFSALADLLYRTIFEGFCDWYLELLKVGEGTPEVAGSVLEQLLALANPVIPFVTEECYSQMPGADGMLLTHPLPVAPWEHDENARTQGMWLIEAVTALRAFRSENGMKPRDPLEVTLVELKPFGLRKEAVAALAHVEWVDDPAAEAQSIPIELGRLLVSRPGAVVDTAAECARLAALIAEAQAELARAERQLANERFVSRAPARLVEAEREKVARFAAEIAELTAERVRLGCT